MLLTRLSTAMSPPACEQTTERHALSWPPPDQVAAADSVSPDPPTRRRLELRYRHLPTPPHITLHPTPVWTGLEALIGLAASLAGLGGYAMARRRLEDARERFPLSAEPLRALARLAQRVGAHDQACRHWDAFFRRFGGMVGSDDRAAYLRALAFSKRGAGAIIEAAGREPMADALIREALADVARYRRWGSLAAVLDLDSDHRPEHDAEPLPPPARDEAAFAALPDGWDAVAALADHAIRAGETDDALALVRCLPAELIGHRIVTELFAWSEAQSERLPEAVRLLNAWHDRHYWPAFDAPLQSLMRLDQRPITPSVDSVAVIAIVHDDTAAALRPFLEHHRALGIGCFLLIDNGLKPADRRFLRDEPDCHLFWTEDNFSGAGDGMRWVNFVLRRHLHDGWVALLRPDQRLVLPEGVPGDATALAAHLRRHGFEAVLAAPPAEDAPRGAASYWMMCRQPFAPAEPPQGRVVLAKARSGRFVSPVATMPLRLADIRLELRETPG